MMEKLEKTLLKFVCLIFLGYTRIHSHLYEFGMTRTRLTRRHTRSGMGFKILQSDYGGLWLIDLVGPESGLTRSPLILIYFIY